MADGPFKTHGLVEHLVSDNGTCFSATEFQAFCAQNATPHKMMSHTLAELLVNHKMTLRLDLVRQRVNVRVNQQQECQKEYNGGIDRGFVPQDTVFAKNHGSGAAQTDGSGFLADRIRIAVFMHVRSPGSLFSRTSALCKLRPEFGSKGRGGGAIGGRRSESRGQNLASRTRYKGARSVRAVSLERSGSHMKTLKKKFRNG